MKTIISTLLAAVLLLSALAGCARDMSGETRTTPSAAPTTAPTATPAAEDGVIDKGEDAVDGVVGAGEDAVDDILEGGEDIVDDTVRTGENVIDDVTGGASGTARPAATPSGKGNG